MAFKCTLADIDNAVHDYRGGESVEVVSARYHIGSKNFRDELSARGFLRTIAERYAIISQKNSRIAWSKLALPVEEIARRYIAGESEASLARYFRVERNAIRARLLEQGVGIRGRLEANRLMMSRRSREEHARNARAAHEATRGRKPSFEVLCKTALTRERRQSVQQSSDEHRMIEWLRNRGLIVIPQKAIGPYNADLAIGAVAVEILGGNWHASGAHRDRAPSRYGYILDRGWNLMLIWVNKLHAPLGIAAADEVMRFVEETERDPTTRGQHRVIWGTGKNASSGSLDLNKLTLVPPGKGS